MDLSEIEKLVEEEVGTIKMSTAILIGAVIRPQIKGDWFRDGGSCALGAAWEGAGRYDEYKKYKKSHACDPYYGADATTALFSVPDSIVDEVYKRNDGGDTREEIAEWLASQGY